ncbi:GH1 family beta-glucosidase, partial [Planobispora rosea]|uniref:GH1 family beta-glucosidase n=1 Tax=Planobispora rosea TaxID=35762 RepID=UPI00083A7A17
MTATGERPDAVGALPQGFVWGVATSAYQIEGAVTADGRGPSIWDAFCRIPGAVAAGETGEHACDHYRRWPEDMALLAGLGAGAYRFSVAWPRVFPEGTGRVNQRGLDFYRRLVEGLNARGVTPFLTLYHWDLPQALEERGGWRVRDTAEYFADYAATVHEALDGVPYWITLNEPYCSSITGYAEGRHAPGAREGHGALAAAHHLLVGHGLATARLRERTREGERIGVTLNMSPAVPASPSAEDAAAARRMDLMVNRQFTEPLLGAAYPADTAEVYGEISDFSFRREGDLEIISAPLDFLGVNYYYPIHAAAAPYGQPDPALRSAYDIGVRTVAPDGPPVSGLGWRVEPRGLYDTLTGLAGRFPGLPPIFITENGYGGGGELDDTGRISYLEQHVAATREAVAAGVDVRGYFCWSLLDNFEWARGYAARFGLVHVDYATQARTPKASYRWYRDVIAAHWCTIVLSAV